MSGVWSGLWAEETVGFDESKTAGCMGTEEGEPVWEDRRVRNGLCETLWLARPLVTEESWMAPGFSNVVREGRVSRYVNGCTGSSAGA